LYEEFMMTRRFYRPLSWVLAASLSFAGLMHSAQAGVIGTAELAAPAQTQQSLAGSAQQRLAATLARADVSAALQARGVDLAQAQARVASLSDAEAALMMEQIDSAPAGAGDILGTIVFIFVLLLVTDILGLTKVFPFTRAIR
jgi:hypothetical protein